MKRFYPIAAAALAISATLSAAAAGAGTAAATTTPVPGPKVPTPPPIAWGACSDPNLQAYKAQCGFVQVPLDYSAPNGTKISIAVSRINHTSSAKDYQGIILTNPGGPGGSGLGLNPFLIGALQQEGYPAAAADYDWIGFDPRGVGSSLPAVTCVPNYFSPDRPNYDPLTPKLLRFWLAKSQAYAQACGNHSELQSRLLRNMTTEDVAMDLDSIRAALGKSQITYYGFSYGTDLGQVYSTLYPTHVRRLIMDSNVNPIKNGYQDFNLDQDGPFNRNADIWFGWLAQYNSVYHLGATESAVRNLYYATEEQLALHPAGGQVGPDEWNDIFVEAGYYEQTWLQMGQAFSDWVNLHNAKAAQELVALYQGIDAPGNDNGFGVYLGVLCTDSHWPLNWSVWNRDENRLNQSAPFETWDNAWFNAPCIFWPAPSTNRVTIDGSGVKSALLIDETLDAATPFPGSLEVRKLFPNSVLLAEPGGTTHADSLSGDKCVDGTIAAYLVSGALPTRKPNAEWDKTCAPLPRPVPTGTASAAPLRLPSSLQGRLGLSAVEVP